MTYNNNFLTEQLINKLTNGEGFEGIEQRPIRDGLGEGLVTAGVANTNIVVVNADLPGSLKLEGFIEKFPERYFQVGVAEQAMAGIGTGLALYGKIPFITSFAAFSPGLNWSQLRLAAISKANIKVASSHYGLNVGEDGASAQMLEDTALMRVLPNFVVISPGDFIQAKQAVIAAAEYEGPVYLRFTRSKFPVIFKEKSEFIIGKAQLLHEGNDVTIITTGSSLSETIKVVMLLKSMGISAELINIHTIKPLDMASISVSVQKTKKLVVLEEHQIAGGLGSAVLEGLADKPVPTKLIGINDQFGESGDGYKLIEKFALNAEALTTQIQNFIQV